MQNKNLRNQQKLAKTWFHSIVALSCPVVVSPSSTWFLCHYPSSLWLLHQMSFPVTVLPSSASLGSTYHGQEEALLFHAPPRDNSYSRSSFVSALFGSCTLFALTLWSASPQLIQPYHKTNCHHTSPCAPPCRYLKHIKTMKLKPLKKRGERKENKAKGRILYFIVLNPWPKKWNAYVLTNEAIASTSFKLIRQFISKRTNVSLGNNWVLIHFAQLGLPVEFRWWTQKGNKKGIYNFLCFVDWNFAICEKLHFGS